MVMQLSTETTGPSRTERIARFAEQFFRSLGARCESADDCLRVELTLEQLQWLEGRPMWALLFGMPSGVEGKTATLYLRVQSSETTDERAELLAPGSALAGANLCSCVASRIVGSSVRAARVERNDAAAPVLSFSFSCGVRGP